VVAAHYARRTGYLVPEKYLVRLEGVRLADGGGMLVLPDRRRVVEVAFTEDHLWRFPAYQGRLPQREKRVSGPHYSLLMLHSGIHNYYHWLHDCVMRLHLVLERLPAETTFVVPPNLRPWETDALAAVGVPAERLLPFDGSAVWVFDDFWFSPPTTIGDRDCPAADAWLRACLGSPRSAGRGSRRVFVSRRDARWRRIVNEEELHPVLRDHGFEIVLLEGYSLRENVRLFEEAEVVVGPHGAGLTNLLFCPVGARVLEIAEPRYAPGAFWTMSEVVGHRHHCLWGETVEDPENQRMPHQRLEPGVFERALVGLLRGGEAEASCPVH